MINLHDLITSHKSEIIALLVGIVATVVIIVFIIGGGNRMTWCVRELVKMYSANNKSWFSKKRIESGIAYIIFQHGMVFWLTKCASVEDFGAWAIIEAGVSGWTVSQIQKEKKMNLDNSGVENKGDSSKEEPEI